MRKTNVILIGLMGVGKSSIAKELADRLSFNVLDTDERIEFEQGKTINEIFAEHGEDHFRQLESRLLRDLKISNTVISTGGGMPVYNANMGYLNELGFTVYLKISPENLSGRLWVMRRKRPLLKSVENIEQLQELLSCQLRQRETYYLSADHVLDVNNKASCEIVDDLMGFIKNLN
ncbi:shikimate kinase [Parvicella tangerina]|uniref:Shikimate kinase n=1 Tax=Parvicella tangerina TaxID=2829795 RepID=A0A916NGQ3_9FLAO|nr:shikimate kinase [Parvicella tangerina]CAG5080291.1 Shikimate kinase [Parvicella tangerina]